MSNPQTTRSPGPSASRTHHKDPATSSGLPTKTGTLKQNSITDSFRKAKAAPRGTGASTAPSTTTASSASTPLTAPAQTPYADARNPLNGVRASQRSGTRGSSRLELSVYDDIRTPSRSPVRSLHSTLPIILSPKVDRTTDMDLNALAVKPSVLFGQNTRPTVEAEAESGRQNLWPCSSSSLSDVTMSDIDEMEVPDDPQSAIQTHQKEKSKSKVAGANVKDTFDPFVSSPTPSPQPNVLKTYTQDMVISASDDEESDDSFSFAPLSSLLPATATPSRNPPPIPRYSSGKRPATTTAKGAKAKKLRRFDWYDLIASAKADQVADECMKKAQEVYNKSAQGLLSPELSGRSDSIHEADQNIDLKKSLQAVIQDDDGAPRIEKVVRAVERTDVSAAHNHVWRFFKEETEDVTLDPPIFPTRNVTKSIARFQKSFRQAGKAESKLKFDYLLLCVSSDNTAVAFSELLTWLLKTCCTTNSSSVHTKASACFAAFPNAITKLTPKFLSECLELLGAKPEAFADDVEFQLTGQSRDQYYENKNWSRLIFILKALVNFAKFLSKEARLATITTLLKLAADAELMASTVVHTAYFRAINAMFDKIGNNDIGATAVHLAEVLETNFKSTTILWSILRRMPIKGLLLANLRRRLSISFLFGEPEIASKCPHCTFGLKEALEYLNRPVFQVGVTTDYRHVRSLIALFDIAIDDGCLPPIPEHPSYDELEGKELLEAFNSDLDAVIFRLKAISRAIHDVNMGSMHPAETKGQIDILLDRLQHTVRHGGAVKPNIYGLEFLHRDGKPAKWSTLVKGGQAKEKGQVSITSFAKFSNKTLDGKKPSPADTTQDTPLLEPPSPKVALQSDSPADPSDMDTVGPPTTSSRRQKPPAALRTDSRTRPMNGTSQGSPSATNLILQSRPRRSKRIASPNKLLFRK